MQTLQNYLWNDPILIERHLSTPISKKLHPKNPFFLNQYLQQKKTSINKECLQKPLRKTCQFFGCLYIEHFANIISPITPIYKIDNNLHIIPILQQKKRNIELYNRLEHKNGFLLYRTSNKSFNNYQYNWI